jgi:hypothetical protein
MLENLLRDEVTEPLVRERFAAFHSYLATARDALMAGRRLPGKARRRTQAAVGHAIAFSTWRSLTQEQRLDDSLAAELMGTLVTSAASE